MRYWIGTLTLLFCLLQPGISSAGSTFEFYDLDFDSDPLGAPPVGGGPFPRNQISEIVFGAPTIIEDGSPLDHALLLDQVGAEVQHEQVSLELGVADLAGVPEFPLIGKYIIELDLTILALGVADIDESRFRILLDSPTSQSVLFRGTGAIDIVFPGSGGPRDIETKRIGDFDFGELIHLRIEADLVDQIWSVFLPGLAPVVTALDDPALDRVRFNTQSVQAVAGGNRVVIDNVTIHGEIIPEPGTAALLAAGLCVMGANRRRGVARGRSRVAVSAARSAERPPADPPIPRAAR